MKVIQLIQSNPDWRLVLQGAPYFVSVRENQAYCLLKYSQIDSDFSQEIVRQCRGIVLRKSDWAVVCRPFDKFFNFGEPYAAQIDWSTARVSQKMDGSIIKLWFDDGWHTSTNGTIDAFEASLDSSTVKSFGELFLLALAQYTSFDRLCAMLDPEYTYMFELCSPFNRVVVSFDRPQLFLIGIRHNASGAELDPDRNALARIFPRPKSYPLGSAEECIAAAKTLGYEDEGFVVVDGNYNRVKIKSPAYVAAHYLLNSSSVLTERLLAVVTTGEQSEFLAYFPVIKDKLDAVDRAYKRVIERLEAQKRLTKAQSFPTRKDFAMWVKAQNFVCEDYIFQLFEHDLSPKDWFLSQRLARQVQLVESEGDT